MKELDFGDYVCIEQLRYGVPNEMFLHKVINRARSNAWVDVPVQSPGEETVYNEMADVVSCILCGLQEKEVLKYRIEDVSRQYAEDHFNCGGSFNIGGSVKENKWISVNEKLPYEDGNSSIPCLVYCKDWGIIVRYFNEYFKHWYKKKQADYYTDGVGGSITHWMPLPEKPEGGEK